MGIGVVAKSHLQPPSTMFLQQIILKITISRFFIRFNFLMSFTCHSHVIRMSFACACILPIFTRIPFVCQSHGMVCHLYVTRTYSYVTRMYLYVIRMSAVCTGMSSISHLYVLACHPYVTHLWFYHEPFNSDILYWVHLFGIRRSFAIDLFLNVSFRTFYYF